MFLCVNVMTQKFIFSLFDNQDRYTGIIFFAGIIAIIGFTFYIIVHGLSFNKKYREELMTKKPKLRFRYLDTFYHYRKVPTSERENNYQLIAYHIIQDVNSQKIYAIALHNTNTISLLEEGKVFRNNKLEGFSTRKNWSEINYNDEGSFWIEKEVANCYQNYGDYITITYYKEETDEVKIDGELFNLNPNYDVSLLNKAIFIHGYAEFGFRLEK